MAPVATSLSVNETLEKRGRLFFRCHVEETVHQTALEIPAWMFDSGCSNMFTVEIPAVNCDALRKVKVLLSASGHDSIVKEAERVERGAHAKETESKTHTDGPVSSDNETLTLAVMPHKVPQATIRLMSQLLRQHWDRVRRREGSHE